MAKIKDGRWVAEDDTPLDPVQLNQVHRLFNRIHDFTNGIVPLTHTKIEILSQILGATKEQELAILRVLKLNTKEIAALPFEDLL